MKRITICILAALALAASIAAWQATAPTWIYGWANGRAAWLQLGPTLALSNGMLDVALPPATVRHYGILLAYDVTRKGWPLPAGAINVVVHVNGMYYSAGNYAIVDGLLTAAYDNLLPEHEVVVEYDSRP